MKLQFRYHGRTSGTQHATGSPAAYAFDASGNLTALPSGATGTYDHAGELITAVGSATTTYAYDAAGRRLTGTQGSTVVTGTWNGAGQLTSYNDATANMSAASYDGTGHRASTTITPSGSSAVTLWGSEIRFGL
jgi:YD repeat-containing protein